MDNDENARLLVEEVLDRFVFHRYVNGLNIQASLELMFMMRLGILWSCLSCNILEINVDDEFIYACSAVAIYHLHNTFVEENLVIYGGEGGHLNQANQFNVWC
jgi:hypothetical protein